MPAGRPRKPTKLLELAGAFKHNPDRAKDRAEEPQPDAPMSATPPGYMSARAKKIWIEWFAVAPPGVMFASDQFSFEQFCELYARCRARRFLVDNKDLMRLEAMYARFGMTPADRTRIKVAQKVDPKKANPHAEFAKPPLRSVA